MTSYFIIMTLFLSIVSAKPDAPIYLNSSSPKMVPMQGVLEGTVSLSNELPQEFYGTWSVSSNLLETNDPETFKSKGTDIWTLSKDREVITLTNPVSGATSSITVNEVKNKTAKFSRGLENEKYKESEIAVITVNGDSFSGTDTIIYEFYKKGKYQRTTIVKYQVEGTRISGPTLREIFAE